MDRAYSTFEVRSVNADRREIAGIASTPEVDRMGDIVESRGLTFKNPVVLLWAHDSTSPIGSVEFEPPTDKGLRFRAKLIDPATVDSETLKERLQMAWDSIKSGLVRAVSIGFRSLEQEMIRGGGIRFLRSEVLELSAVSIPANASATLQVIRAYDAEARRAASTATSTPKPAPAPIHRARIPSTEEAEAMRSIATIPDSAARYAVVERAKTYLDIIRAKVAAGNEGHDAAGYYSRGDATRQSQFETIQKSAVDAGSTTGWGSGIAQLRPAANAFVELTRQRSAIGQMTGFRRAPFQVSVPRQTAGATATWVGEGRATPVTNLAFDSLTLEHSKIGAIIVLSRELAKLGSPDANALIDTDLTKTVGVSVDSNALNPTIAAGDDHPASLTYGVTPVNATGTTYEALKADLLTLFAQMSDGGATLEAPYLVMSRTMALQIALGIDWPSNPTLGVNGGDLFGVPVLTTSASLTDNNSPSDEFIAAIDAASVLMADDGVEFSVSQQGAVQMDTAPDSPPTTTTVMIGLWQHNLSAIKINRFIRWTKAVSGAAGYINGANYGAA